MGRSRKEFVEFTVQPEGKAGDRPLLICLVHGTFQASFPREVRNQDSDPALRTLVSIPTELAAAARKAGWEPAFGEYKWGPGIKRFPFENWNNKESIRWEAARGLREKLVEKKKENPELTIMTVGHSHGGRVSVMANSLGETEVIDLIVGLSSPYFEDLSDGNHASAAGHRESVKAAKKGQPSPAGRMAPRSRSFAWERFAVWKAGIFILFWSLSIFLLAQVIKTSEHDPIEWLALQIAGLGGGSSYSFYLIYTVVPLATASVLSVLAIRAANRRIMQARIQRSEDVEGQVRGDAITLSGERVAAFINARDEVQQYLGFQQRVIGLAASFNKVTPLLFFCAIFLTADDLKHGEAKLKDGWVSSVAARLEVLDLMPDYDYLVTKDDRFFSSEENLKKELEREEEKPLDDRRPLPYTTAAYALKALHLTLCITVLMEAFRWLMAFFSTTQFGLGGRMSWILAGGIRLRRGPGAPFTGYEVTSEIHSYTLMDLRELIGTGHGALLRDEKSRRHWMESAFDILERTPPTAKAQVKLGQISEPISAAAEALKLDKPT